MFTKCFDGISCTLLFASNTLYNVPPLLTCTVILLCPFYVSHQYNVIKYILCTSGAMVYEHFVLVSGL